MQQTVAPFAGEEAEAFAARLEGPEKRSTASCALALQAAIGVNFLRSVLHGSGAPDLGSGFREDRASTDQ